LKSAGRQSHWQDASRIARKRTREKVLMTTLQSWRFLLGLSLCALGPSVVMAQGPGASTNTPAGLGAVATPGPQQVEVHVAPQDSPPQTLVQANDAKKEKKEKRGAIVIAPIPISNPALGTGAVIGAGYIFPLTKTDKVSPPSVLGALGMFTNNGSRMWGVGAQLYFNQNRYQATGFYAQGNLDYDLYGSNVFAGLELPLKQAGRKFQGEFLRNVGWRIFAGPRVEAGDSLITILPSTGPVPPLPPDVGLRSNLVAVGAALNRDTTPNRFYPVSGTIFSFTSDFYLQTLGSKYSYKSYETSFNKYWSWSESRVLAFNGYSCATSGAPPFYGNCIYGNGNELRGYVAGKYFDRYTLASQLEFRLAFPFHLGVVGFGGVGEAIPGGDQLLFRNNSFLPSGGVGLRLLVSKAYHVNLRCDYAQSKDGHTFTLGVGEAF
jgi:hypothetical protein